MSDIGSAIITVLTVLAGSAALTIDQLPAMPVAQYDEASDDGDAEPLSAHLNTDGRVYVPARVNGRELLFQLDTGASHTILNREGAKIAQVKPEGSIRLAVVGGTISAAHATVSRLDIAGAQMRDQRIFIVDELPNSLLGMDTISQLHNRSVSISIGNETSR